MSVHAPASDRLSLALPNWRAALKRIQRYKPPRDPWFWFFRVVAVWNAVDSVQAWAAGHPIGGAADLILAVISWRVATLPNHLNSHIVLLPLWFALIATQIVFHG